MSLREWTVAGGLLETPAGVLLVRNVRRGGFEDWSTPGGVIDADDADLLAGLTREVEEETGLVVREWSGPLYEVHALAPDMGWRMRCEVHLAVAFEGDAPRRRPRRHRRRGRVRAARRVRRAPRVVRAVGARAAGGVAARAVGAARRASGSTTRCTARRATTCGSCAVSRR